MNASRRLRARATASPSADAAQQALTRVDSAGATWRTAHLTFASCGPRRRRCSWCATRSQRHVDCSSRPAQCRPCGRVQTWTGRCPDQWGTVFRRGGRLERPGPRPPGQHGPGSPAGAVAQRRGGIGCSRARRGQAPRTPGPCLTRPAGPAGRRVPGRAERPRRRQPRVDGQGSTCAGGARFLALMLVEQRRLPDRVRHPRAHRPPRGRPPAR